MKRNILASKIIKSFSHNSLGFIQRRLIEKLLNKDEREHLDQKQIKKRINLVKSWRSIDEQRVSLKSATSLSQLQTRI